jgi:tetratricopeptide (TPR) repeat protein
MSAAAARGDEEATVRAARQHYLKGAALFDLERYDDAITEYEAAYQAKNDPSLLFNIAQAHRKAHHLEPAIHFYQAYLARDPDTEDRARIEQRITELQSQLPAAAKATATAATATANTPAAATRAPRPARAKLGAGVAVGVAGVGLAIGGIVLTALSGHAANQLTAANNGHAAYDPRLYSTYQNDATSGGVMLGIGAGALATGGALLTLELRRRRAQGGHFAFNF